MDIEWSRRARGDLRDIAAYIAQDNPDAADCVTDRIVAATETLSTFPSIGRPGRIDGTRELVVSGTPYIVPYRIRPDRVELIAVLHGAQQWPDSFP